MKVWVVTEEGELVNMLHLPADEMNPNTRYIAKFEVSMVKCT